MSPGTRMNSLPTSSESKTSSKTTKIEQHGTPNATCRLTRQPSLRWTKESKKHSSFKLYMPSTVSYGNVAQCQQSGFHDSQDNSGDVKTKKESQGIDQGFSYPKSASVHCHIVEGNEWYQIPVCGSPNGNPLQITTRCHFPFTGNLTVDKEITSCKQKYALGWKIHGRQLFNAPIKPFI